MSAQLSTALGLGIRELAQALVLAMSGAATAALAFVGAARGRRRLRRHRLGAISAGPWTPAETGVRVLLEGGPARFRAGRLTIVVEDGGALAIGPGRHRASVGTLVVGRGCTLRVAAAQVGHPEGSAAGGQGLWLCAGRPSAAVESKGARSEREEPPSDRSSARRLLDERLARGEIDVETYERLRDALDGGGRGDP